MGDVNKSQETNKYKRARIRSFSMGYPQNLGITLCGTWVMVCMVPCASHKRLVISRKESENWRSTPLT